MQASPTAAAAQQFAYLSPAALEDPSMRQHPAAAKAAKAAVAAAALPGGRLGHARLHPHHASHSPLGLQGGDGRRFSGRSLVPEYVWRALHPSQMDLEYCYSQMVWLILRPSEAYQLTRFRKEIKNQWSRDDPAFVVILVAFIAAAALAFSVAFGSTSLWHWTRIVLGSVLIEFLGAGVLVATAGQHVANRYLRVRRVMSTDQEVEWLYAFDIHCNGFFPVFLLLYVVQYFLVPALLAETFLATLAANTLYAAAFSYYFYVTFLGYSVLPFLERTTKFLYPIGGIAVAYVLTLLLRWNVCRAVFGYYFG